LCLALSALFVPVLCLAQAQGQPRLVLEATQFDFGKINPGATVSHRFKASNTGDAPLTISKLSPSCGCTSTLVGKETLAPGESTELEVSFNSAGEHGVISKSVAVESDDPVSPRQTLNFQAEVLPAVTASTEQVQFLDLLPRDRRKASVHLVNGSGKPMRVTGVDLSAAPWLGVSTRENGSEAWVDFDLLAGKLPPGKLSGTDSAAVHLADPDPTVVDLAVYWELRSPIRFTPPRVAWVASAGEAQSTTVTFVAVGPKAFRILASRTTNPLVQVAGIATRPARQQTFRVLLSGDAKPGRYDEKVFLTLDTPGHPEVELRVDAVLR